MVHQAVGATHSLVEHYLYGLFSFAIIFIALFITFYSYLFLTKTVRHKERRPWDFLFIASLLFLGFEILSLLHYLGIIMVLIDVFFWSKIFEFLYSGFVLLAFISQHDLILRNHLILISKKDEELNNKIQENLAQAESESNSSSKSKSSKKKK